MKKTEYDSLVSVLDYHMDRYYNQDEPEISDYEYDMLMQKLKRAEREHPEWITPDSPSQKIGGTAQSEQGNPVSHRVPMLSIEDVFDRRDIADWVDRVVKIHPDALFSVEAKIDGVSLSLGYKRDRNGHLSLSSAETRGTGYIGGDVLENARAMATVPQALPFPFEGLELRGEVYVTREDFERYNAGLSAGEQSEKTARNLAASALRRINPGKVKTCGLKVSIFNIQDGPFEIAAAHTAGMERLAAAGVPTVPHTLCANAREVLAAIEKFDQLRPLLPYEIDGVVVKLDQTAYRDDFPAGPKYSPGHIAYKFPPKGENV